MKPTPAPRPGRRRPRLVRLPSHVRSGRADACPPTNACASCSRSCAEPGLHADGAVGDEDPVVAIEDSLRGAPADMLVLAVHAPDCEHYREHGLVERVRSRVDVPVETVMLDAEGRVVDLVRA